MVLRAVVVDELPLICDGIVAAMASSREWLVTDKGVSAAGAVRLVDRDRTDLIVFGFSDVDQALDAIGKIIAKAAHVIIVCLAAEGEGGGVQRLLRALGRTGASVGLNRLSIGTHGREETHRPCLGVALQMAQQNDTAAILNGFVSSACKLACAGRVRE